MKTLSKKSFAVLEQEFPVLKENQLTEIVGGQDSYSFTVANGTFVNYYHEDGNYSVYYPSDGGSSVVFDGVHVNGNTLPFQGQDTACQLNGQIRVGSEYASYFTLEDTVHEYGHYLQQQEMGTYKYIKDVGLNSIQTVYESDHSSQWYEQDATQRGNDYMNQYYPGYYYY
ncbi:MAG: hypothetical protein LBL04_02870 [Bacteroidales bacterium]|jgi:hypothetical protein|nr:hypothetical protein [Bacteroidales bacterium]